MPSDVAAMIQRDAGPQVTVLTYPYWSMVRWSPTIAANAATLDTAERRAFGYASGSGGTIAGFAATYAITGTFPSRDRRATAPTCTSGVSRLTSNRTAIRGSRRKSGAAASCR